MSRAAVERRDLDGTQNGRVGPYGKARECRAAGELRRVKRGMCMASSGIHGMSGREY